MCQNNKKTIDNDNDFHYHVMYINDNENHYHL